MEASIAVVVTPSPSTGTAAVPRHVERARARTTEPQLVAHGPDRVVSPELSQADQRDRVMEAFTGLGQDDVIVQLSFLVTDG